MVTGSGAERLVGDLPTLARSITPNPIAPRPSRPRAEAPTCGRPPGRVVRSRVPTSCLVRRGAIPWHPQNVLSGGLRNISGLEQSPDSGISQHAPGAILLAGGPHHSVNGPPSGESKQRIRVGRLPDVVINDLPRNPRVEQHLL